jgi:pantoate--beta-alanine ligase
MEIYTRIEEMQQHAEELRKSGRTIGFVPTMGYLHEGHLDLIREAKKHADAIVVSIFVNPTQFGKNEDLDKYPRDLGRDRALAESVGCDMLFVPAAEEMYAADFSTYVRVDGLASVLEGVSRPDHFRGVTTIVAKLFNIVKPHVAFFGQKDAQQAAIIRKMVRELNFDIRIVVIPIRRENDGLAMSSRNTYLSADERNDALSIHRALRSVEQEFESGERDAGVLCRLAARVISESGNVHVEYVEIVDAQSLQPIESIAAGIPAILLVAARVGKTRLIDNTILA